MNFARLRHKRTLDSKHGHGSGFCPGYGDGYGCGFGRGSNFASCPGYNTASGYDFGFQKSHDLDGGLFFGPKISNHSGFGSGNGHGGGSGFGSGWD